MSNINSTIRVKDGQGNINTVYPVTTINNVDGLQAALDSKAELDSTGKVLSTQLPSYEALIECIDKNAKNICPNTATSQGIFTVNEDGTVIANGSIGASAQNLEIGKFTLKAGKTYRMHSNNSVSGSTYFMGLAKLPQSTTIYTEFGSPTFTPSEDTVVQAYLIVQANQTVNNVKFEPMVCLEIDWQASQQYIPHALSNYELTKLESEDRAALAEAIDNGVKNRLDDVAWMNSALVVVNGDKTVANDEITLHAESNDCYTEFGLRYPVEHRIPVTEGETVVLSWDYASTNTTDRVLLFPNGSASGAVAALSQEKALSYKVSSGVTFVTFRIGVDKANTSATYSHIMCCTIEEWKVSKKYVPKGNGNATTTSDGLMSADDKTKLDGISNKSAASGGTDVSLCTTGEKYNWNRKQNALILGDYSLDLNSLTFTQSASGMYYSTDIYVGDFNQIFSAMAYDFASLKVTDNVNVMISTDRKKIAILSNVNSFDAGAALELQIVGI